MTRNRITNGYESRSLIAGSALIVAIFAILPSVLLMGPWHFAGSDTSRLTAVLTFLGVLVTASVSFIGLMIKHQADRRASLEHDEQAQSLRLDAAMRAGQLLTPTELAEPAPAAVASGLLALTNLERADLAVALLVDLWRSDGSDKVSHEVAVLVIDKALRSDDANAQLIAAELLCRRASTLDACQSLHWPSAVDGVWNTEFLPRTKLLLVDALVRMTLSGPRNEGALRAAAVRLYGIWRDDRDSRVQGCIGKLIDALIDQLRVVNYEDFVQGSQWVKLDQLVEAAASKKMNPDGYLDNLSTNLAKELKAWSSECVGLPAGPGSLAMAERGSATISPLQDN